MVQPAHAIPVDMSNILAALGNNLDVLEKIIDYLRDISPKQLEQLGQAIDRQDHSMVAQTAHSLKEALVNFNVQKAVHLAAMLEQSGKAGNLSMAAKLFEDLNREVRGILAYFEDDTWRKDWL